MGKKENHLVFTIDDQQFGLPMSQVERIIRAVEVRPVPEAPDYINGVINMQGRVIPVVNLRKRFRLPE
ncbi:MAG: chemotaxis protein CheW, partial [bacterium]